MSSIYCLIWVYFSISSFSSAYEVSLGWSFLSVSQLKTFKWSSWVAYRLQAVGGISLVYILSYALMLTIPVKFRPFLALYMPSGLIIEFYFLIAVGGDKWNIFPPAPT